MNPEPAPLAELLWNPSTWLFWAIMVFVMGLLWGSYFNVAIYRWPLGMTTNRPRRSFCFRCGSTVRPQDNIPILSWLLLRGRCHSCGVRISPRYAIVEMLTALTFTGIFVLHNPPDAPTFHVATIWYFVFAGLLIIGTFTDLDHWIITDGVTKGGAVAALVASVLIGIVDPRSILTDNGPLPAIRNVAWNDPFSVIEGLLLGSLRDGAPPPQWYDAPANALLGAIVGPAILWAVGVLGKVLFRKDAMGMGDVKLFALIGATLGPANVFVVLVLASLFGSIGGFAAILAGRLGNAAAASPLAEGAAQLEAPSEGEAPSLLRLLLDKNAGREPARALHHLPFGPWIALGALLALLFHEPLRALLRYLLVPG